MPRYTTDIFIAFVARLWHNNRMQLCTPPTLVLPDAPADGVTIDGMQVRAHVLMCSLCARFASGLRKPSFGRHRLRTRHRAQVTSATTTLAPCTTLTPCSCALPCARVPYADAATLRREGTIRPRHAAGTGSRDGRGTRDSAFPIAIRGVLVHAHVQRVVAACSRGERQAPGPRAPVLPTERRREGASRTISRLMMVCRPPAPRVC